MSLQNIDEYEVVYRIQIGATGVLDAALKVEHIFKNPVFRPCFEVKKVGQKNTVVKIVDLEKEL